MSSRVVKAILCDPLFESVDGTLIEAWASHKSVRRKDGSDDDNPDGLGRNAGRNFHGEQRSNETHTSTTDPDARLARKGDAQASKLAYAGHIVTENRNALVVDAALTQASGTAERDAGVTMLERRDWISHNNGIRCCDTLEHGVPDPPRPLSVLGKPDTRHRLTAGTLVLVKSIVVELRHEYLAARGWGPTLDRLARSQCFFGPL